MAFHPKDSFKWGIFNSIKIILFHGFIFQKKHIQVEEWFFNFWNSWRQEWVDIFIIKHTRKPYDQQQDWVWSSHTEYVFVIVCGLVLQNFPICVQNRSGLWYKENMWMAAAGICVVRVGYLWISVPPHQKEEWMEGDCTKKMKGGGDSMGHIINLLLPELWWQMGQLPT